MSTSSVHLPVPTGLRRFTCFADFPFDIRLQIWEDIIYTTGIHFLKFKPNANLGDPLAPRTQSGDNTTAAEPAPEKIGLDAKRSKLTSTLEPIFCYQRADKSHYLNMRKIVMPLMLACNEAKELFFRLVERPGNLFLYNRRLVLLDKSSDIVCIDYPGATSTRALGRWAEHLDLEQLAKIRRIAVRYNTKWDEKCRVCRTCGIIPNFHHSHDARPRHVYQLAALFKNLETFYFLDCLAVRKQRDKSSPTSCVHTGKEHGDKGENFVSREVGRTYFEVDPQTCKFNTHVLSALEWARHNYISYCHKRSTGTVDPEKVKFKVLACEWDTDELVPVKRQESKPLRSFSKQPKWQVATITDDFKRLCISGTDGSVLQKKYGGIAHQLPVEFGDGGKSKFEFTFEVPFSASNT
ncbi:hypothetical protein F4677DRAFT_424855 [Hypoxylon crocopeplum]|nr:hypothetical protein F4677DRAFT_424855 [Hypoxylon crocopeplum]